MSESHLRTVGENPTSIVGVNNVKLVLNADTDIDTFFQNCALAAPPHVQTYLACFKDKNITSLDDPGEMLSAARKAADDAITPQKSSSALQQNLTNAMNAATPRQNGANEEVSPKVKPSTIKLMGEAVKFNANFESVATYLRTIIGIQPAEITAHFETMDVNKKHAIYEAIDKLKVKSVRTILTETFHKAYPAEDRIRKFVDSITQITFDESTQDLLTLRTMFMTTMSKLNQMTDVPGYELHKGYATSTTILHFRKLIDQTRDATIKVILCTELAAVEKLDADKLADILLKVDARMRANSPGTYPPKVTVHVAQPARAPASTGRARTERAHKKGDKCAMCNDRWGYDWYHSPETCILGPQARSDKLIDKWDARWAEDNPGKELKLRLAKDESKKRTHSNTETSPPKKSKERSM
jgi:hypothetical protein